MDEFKLWKRGGGSVMKIGMQLGFVVYYMEMVWSNFDNN